MTATPSADCSLLLTRALGNLASFTSEHAYNDLRGGRVGALLAASLAYEQTNKKELVPHLKQMFGKLIEDSFFCNDTLIWLAPPTEGYNKLLFTRNIGIYLGLWLVREYLNQETGIPPILNNISFDTEIREIASTKYRKRIKLFLQERMASVSVHDIQDFIDYYETCKSRVVLEAVVCLCFKSGLFRVASIFRQVETLLSQIDSVASALVSDLKVAFFTKSPVPSVSVDLATCVIPTLIRNQFKSIFQYCGDAFVETTLLNGLDTEQLRPRAWLTLLHKRYPNRNIVFNQIIRRERFLLTIPIRLFEGQTNNERINYHLDFVKACYQAKLDTLFTYQFRLSTTRFIYKFNTFCIKLLPSQDFAQLNHPLKLSYFRQYYKNIHFSLLLVKRHEKTITWQGRSFTNNLDVDFLFFFMGDFRSLNEYKIGFTQQRLSDTEMLEIFFWALELGMIEPDISFNYSSIPCTRNI